MKTLNNLTALDWCMILFPTAFIAIAIIVVYTLYQDGHNSVEFEQRCVERGGHVHDTWGHKRCLRTDWWKQQRQLIEKAPYK